MLQALARAIYSGAKTIILDDIFSSLDGNTEERICQRIFGTEGFLSQGDFTIIFATHSGMSGHETGLEFRLLIIRVKWLPLANNIIVMEAGHVAQSGSFDHLNSTPGIIQNLMLQQRSPQHEKGAHEIELKKETADCLRAQEPDVLTAGRVREWSVYAYYAASLGWWRCFVYVVITCASAGVLAYQSELIPAVIFYLC